MSSTRQKIVLFFIVLGLGAVFAQQSFAGMICTPCSYLTKQNCGCRFTEPPVVKIGVLKGAYHK